MGKGRKHTIKRGRKNQGGRFKKVRRTDEAGWDVDDGGKGGSNRRGDWSFGPRKNELFVEYYRELFLGSPPPRAKEEAEAEAEGQAPQPEQQLRGGPREDALFASEEEWNEFMASLERDLPTTFRITAHSPMAPLVRAKLSEDFQPRLHLLDLGSELLPNLVQFEPLPWYPQGNGWYLRTPRRALKRTEALTQFHQFLVNSTEVGETSRQEAVSMIPPVFLKVESHHKVLDMCAAPGSKTAQLIEYLHEGLAPGQIPSGMVVANDVDENRCYMLVHQVKRISSPCVMMTNYAAQSFPSIRILQDDGSRGDPAFFDRILCDVPCSGDGTLRKNFDLWNKWHPGLGTALHVLQLRIATRAARLLKVGGRMVYSTCSFNPIEDEAVVAELIRRGKGSLELVDMSGELSGLKRSPGIKTWKVYDLFHKSRDTKEKEYKWYASHSELPPRRQEAIPATCFPPSAEELESLHLERCVRIFPHQQDTGGFFIVAIQKVAEMPPVPGEDGDDSTSTSSSSAAPASEEKTEVPEAEPKQEEQSDKPAEPAGMELEQAPAEAHEEDGEEKKGGKGKGKKRESREEPYLPLSATLLAQWALVKEYFGITEDFPEKQLMARGESSPRIYFLSKAVADVLWKNTARLNKIVNTGVRLLVKHAPPGATCQYRPCQEGLTWLYPYITKRIVKIPFEDLSRLLLEDTPFLTSFTPETQKQLDTIDAGCCVFVCNVSGKDTPMLACGWKARTTVHLLVSKQDRRSWISLLSIDKADESSKSTEEKPATETAASASEPAPSDPEAEVQN